MADDPVLLDRYELGEVLGRGGSAVVRRGWDRRLERPVAVKIIPADGDDLALLRRRREVDLLSAMRHPGLVALLDVVLTPDANHLVMELLEGGTLHDGTRCGAMDPVALAAVAADLAGGLAHIHAHGVVHRDVKPGNVLLAAPPSAGAAPVAKLADFGIAKLLETSATHSTGVVGTVRYLSPEQARGLQVGPASDVYSLGLTLLEAATGRPAFPGTTSETLAARLLRDPVVPGWLGADWRSLLVAMTRRDPAARPTAEEVLRRATVLRDRADRFPAEHAETQPLTLPIAVPLAAAPLGIVGRAVPALLATVILVVGGAALALPSIDGGARSGPAVAAAADRDRAPASPTPGSSAPAASASTTGRGAAGAGTVEVVSSEKRATTGDTATSGRSSTASVQAPSGQSRTTATHAKAKAMAKSLVKAKAKAKAKSLVKAKAKSAAKGHGRKG